MKIVPMRDLKDTVKIEAICKENGKVFVTKNGYGRLVVMDIDYYNDMHKEFEEAKAISEGIKQVKENDIKDGEKTLKELKEKYDL